VGQHADDRSGFHPVGAQSPGEGVGLCIEPAVRQAFRSAHDGRPVRVRGSLPGHFLVDAERRYSGLVSIQGRCDPFGFPRSVAEVTE
jgi:hypothetical protein